MTQSCVEQMCQAAKRTDVGSQPGDAASGVATSAQFRLAKSNCGKKDGGVQAGATAVVTWQGVRQRACQQHSINPSIRN
jgi:hypothetical protein